MLGFAKASEQSLVAGLDDTFVETAKRIEQSSARADRRSLRHAGFLCAVAIALCSCGSDGSTEAASTTVSGDTGEAAPTTMPDDMSAAEKLVAELDCETATNVDSTFEESRWPFSESIDCWTDGRPSIRIHTFEAARTSEVSKQFQVRYSGGLNQCPTGDRSRQYVAVADSWAVVTTSEALLDRVLTQLGGTATRLDDNAPPVSYPMVDPCPASPPIGAG